jgi:hypothetical protein
VQLSRLFFAKSRRTRRTFARPNGESAALLSACTRRAIAHRAHGRRLRIAVLRSLAASLVGGVIFQLLGLDPFAVLPTLA